MNKFANAKELVTELRTLLAYAEGHQPSREKLAHGLQTLANRTAKSTIPGVAERQKAEAALISALALQYPDVPKAELESIVQSGINSIGAKAKARNKSN